jgi:SAM-dependent methyltransferase
MSINQYVDGSYFERHPTWDMEHAPLKAKYVKIMIDRHNMSCKKMLDVGCGNGAVLAELHKLMPTCKMHGFDIFPQSISMGHSLFGNMIDLQCTNPFKQADIYDLALALDVIEHVENTFQFLAQLKEKATFKILHIPLEVNLRWLLTPGMYKGANKSNGHIHFFNQETAFILLEWSGYEVVDYILTPHSIELANNFRSKIALLPRKLLAIFDEELANKIFGGWSLLVLCK